MKNRKVVLSVVIAVAMILGGLIVFTNYKINRALTGLLKKRVSLKMKFIHSLDFQIHLRT